MDLDLLTYESLMGMINEFEAEELTLLNSGICPDESDLTQSFVWDILGIPRDVSKFQSKHSASDERKLVVIGQQSARPATTFLNKKLTASQWQDIRNPGSTTRQAAAARQIALDLKDLDDTIKRQDEFMIAGALQGQLDITVHDIPVSIDYGIPVANVFGLALGGDQQIAVDWSDPAAKIGDDVRRMMLAGSHSSGRTMRRAYASGKILEHIMASQEFQEKVGNTESGAQVFREGSIGRFRGLDWFRLDHSFLDGVTPTPYWDENTVVLTPNPDRSWLSMLRGGQMIPTNDGRGLQEVLGKASWAGMLKDPPAIALFLRDVRIPAVKIPGALVKATVTA